jgi:hypothetical protein
MDDATTKLKLYSWTLRNLLALKTHSLSLSHPPQTFKQQHIPSPNIF